MNPSVAVLLNEGLLVLTGSALSFAFLSLAVLLSFVKSKPPIFPSRPLSELLDLPENIESFVLVITPVFLYFPSNLGGLEFASDFGGRMAPQFPHFGALS